MKKKNSEKSTSVLKMRSMKKLGKKELITIKGGPDLRIKQSDGDDD